MVHLLLTPAGCYISGVTNRATAGTQISLTVTASHINRVTFKPRRGAVSSEALRVCCVRTLSGGLFLNPSPCV